MKRFLPLLVLAFALIAAGEVRAETVSTRLTPEKLGDHLYSFTIKVERLQENAAGEFLQFHVTVKPTKAGKAARLPRRSGTLVVNAGKEFVSSCDLQPTARGDEVSYSFRVAAKYAENSSFTFAETAGHEVETGGVYYWFTLKDFVATAPAAPAPAPAADKLKIENPLGFHTATSAEFLRKYWESVKDTHKMKGKVSDHLTREQIETIIVLEVNISIADGPKYPGLDDELLAFMTADNSFDVGPLPADFEKNRPAKYVVALIRTKKGDYGLVTRYAKFAVVELNGRVGVAPVVPAKK